MQDYEWTPCDAPRASDWLGFLALHTSVTVELYHDVERKRFLKREVSRHGIIQWYETPMQEV